MNRMLSFLKKHPLWISYAAGIVIAIIFLAGNTHEIYRDQAAYYAPMAEAFAHGDWAEAFPPDIPILTSMLAGLLVYCGLSSLTALMAVGAAFHIATLYPLNRLLCLVLSERMAALGCFLFIISPKVIRFNCMGLPDSGRTFFLVALVLVLAEYLRRPGVSWAVWGGVIAGALSLVRSEGLVYAGVAGVVFLYPAWRQWRIETDKAAARYQIQKALVYCITFGVMTLCVIAPRLYGNYQTTGLPVCDTRHVSFLKQMLHIPTKKKQPGTEINRLQTQLYVHVDSPVQAAPPRRTFFNLGDLLNDWVRGSYELYLCLAAVGLVLLLWRREWRAEHTLCVIFMAVTVLIFAPLVVAYRYFLVNVPLMMPFTVLPLAEVGKYGSRFRYFRAAALIALAVLAVAQTVNATSVFRDPSRECEVGRWIASHREELSGGAERFWVIADTVRIPYWSGTYPRLFWEGEAWHPKQVAAFEFEKGSSGVFVFEMRQENSLAEEFQRNPRFERVTGHPYSDEIAIFKYLPSLKTQ